MKEITDGAALITGGSRGIGRAVAVELARRGRDIAIFYAGNTAAAEETVRQVQQLGKTAKAYPCDVADAGAVSAAVAQVLQDFGSVAVLVNNAGITKDNLLLAQNEADWDRVLDVSLKGSYHLIRALYRPFLRRRSGRIINIASVVALHGNSGQANYAAAKAGIIGLTKSVAKELAGRGVTCNAVAPGLIQSDMTQAMKEQARSAVIGAIPLGRAGRPEDVAKAVAFLASEDAAYLTGVVLRVDGGLGM